MESYYFCKRRGWLSKKPKKPEYMGLEVFSGHFRENLVQGDSVVTLSSDLEQMPQAERDEGHAPHCERPHGNSIDNSPRRSVTRQGLGKKVNCCP